MTLFTRKIRRAALMLLTCLSLCLISLGLSSCEETEPPVGRLAFEYSASEGGYLAYADNTYRERELIIPATHEGEPVVGVRLRGFENSPNLERVVFESTEHIKLCREAFRNCASLKSVEFTGEGVEWIYLDTNAFVGCNAIDSLRFTSGKLTNDIFGSVFGEHLTSVGSVSAGGAQIDDITWQLKNAKVGVASVGDGGRLTLHATPSRVVLENGSYYYCGSTDGGISDEIVFADGYSFADSEIWVCGAPATAIAKKIVIPISVTSIPQNFFGNGGDAPIIEYAGTEEDWARITVDSRGNANFTNGNYEISFTDPPPAPKVYYTVKFLDVNGNEVAPERVVESGSFISAPAPKIPECYIFSHWSLSDSEDYVVIWNSLLPITSDLTVYAHFIKESDAKDAELISVSGFELVDGVYKKSVRNSVSSLEISLTVSPNASLDILDSDGLGQSVHSISLREGKNIFTVRVTSGDKSTVRDYTIEIYRNKMLTVTFKPENGEADRLIRTEEGVPFDIPRVTRKGYFTNSWTVDPIDAITVTTETVAANRDCTIKVVWYARPYTVSFTDTDLMPYSVDYDSIVTLPVPKRTNFRFLGWETNDGKRFTDESGKMLNPYSYDQNISLVARWEAIVYEISYENLMGATVNNPESYTVNDSNKPLSAPSVDWYVFTGWYTDRALTDRVTEINTSAGGSITLYAGWELASYTACYIALGETVHTVEFTKETASWSDPEIPARAGYTAVWSTYTVKPETIRIEAIYTPITYRIEYLGADGLENPNPTSYTVESDLTLKSPKRTGYTFLGWYDQDGKNVTRIAPGSHGDITLTARWESGKYKISYTGTKSADTSALPTEYKYSDGEIALPDLTLAYHDFIGWLDESGNYVSSISANSEGDRVFTAVFVAHIFTITYSGLEGAENKNPESFTSESEFELYSPERRGYTFLGWYDESGKNVTRVALGTHNSLDLTARWELTVYKITYNVPAMIDTTGFVKSYTVLDGPITLPTISSAAFEFLGWTHNGEPISVIPAGSVGDILLVANLKTAEMTIVLETPYGSVAGSVSVKYGESFTLPVPSTEGKIFLGWFDSTGDNAVAYTDSSGKSLSPYLHLTSRVLYAKFEAVKCYISFDTVGGDPIATIAVDYGSAFNDRITPVKENAVFAGWYTSDMATRYTSSTIIKSSITVYAKWITAKPISTAEELIAIANDPGGSYYLTADINLRGAIWTPIENFSGVLDGKGHTIKNFMLSTSVKKSAFGFVSTNSGRIENLVFSDFTYNVSVRDLGGMAMGVFTGTNSGTVYGCTVESGIIKITYYNPDWTGDLVYGCFAGTNSATGTVEGCTSLEDIEFNFTHNFSRDAMFDEWYTNHYSVGAIVGYNVGTISDCYSEGKLTYVGSSTGGNERNLEDYSFIGGIAGQNRGGTIVRCHSAAVIEVSHKTGTQANSYTRLGGILGYNENALVTGCYFTGSIYVHDIEEALVGGLIGYITGTNATVNNCYAKAKVRSASPGSAGGFVGKNESPIQNCYCTGDVESTGTASAGGFVGHNNSAGTVSKCYSSGNVTAASKNGGYFAGLTSGVLFRCFYLSGTNLFVNGEYKSYIVEHNTVEGKLYSVLWSESFLVDTLYWDDEGWIILINEDPILEWETSVDHNYKKIVIAPTCTDFGYTIYSCSDCDRFFIKDWVDAQGHDETVFEVVDPTCTDFGYTTCYCLRCDETYVKDIKDPLGHKNGKLLSSVDPTCTEDGCKVYECSRCKDTHEQIIPAVGHTKALRPAVAQTCTTEGRTKEIYCSVCLEIIEASRPIAPHNFRSPDDIISSPTCTEDGLCNKYCLVCKETFTNVVIPATGHSDINGDYLCDSCGIIYGSFSEDAVIEIKTVEDLIAIKNNLGGTYRLMKNLYLPNGWKPIGEELDPFWGYFDGNGYTIFLPDMADQAIGGVFGYSYGVITGLTVQANSITVTNVQCVYGLVTAYNYGTVANCKLVGALRLEYAVRLTSAELKRTSLDSKMVFGGIVGINAPTGRVIDCVFDANVDTVITNYAICDAPWQLMSLFGDGKHKETVVETMQTFVFGCIVGENGGEIASCTVGGYVYHGRREKGAYMLYTSANNRFGYAYATTHYYCGVVAGINGGQIVDCEHITFHEVGFEGFDLTCADSGHFFGVVYDFSFYNDGLVGKNNAGGTVDC